MSFDATNHGKEVTQRDTEEAQSDTEKSISPWNSLFVFFSVELCVINPVE
jgi:hypothetical protein